MQSPRGSSLSSIAWRLFVLGCLLLLSVLPALAQESSDQQAAQQTVPSYTLDKGYVVPTLVTPSETETPKRVKKYERRGSPVYPISQGAKRTRKLLRGIHNVLFGWVEVPKTIMTDVVMVDPLTGFVTGVVVGSAKTIERTGVGVVEILTFWHEWPREYRPIIEPEYVWGDLTD